MWHCALRNAADGRVLSDAQWAEVAQDLLHRTGLARRGDDGECRWVAVRHDDASIHVVVVLARQDGGTARLSNDWRQVRQTCLAAERRLALVATPPAVGTTARYTSRAEVEKAARAGRALPDRDWLRERVQHAAAGSRDTTTFPDRLRRDGVVVRERRDETGVLRGYAVARPLPSPVEPASDSAARVAGRAAEAQAGAGATSAGLVFFGGGKLAVELSLPRLQARWAPSKPPGQLAAAAPATRPEGALTGASARRPSPSWTLGGRSRGLPPPWTAAL